MHDDTPDASLPDDPGGERPDDRAWMPPSGDTPPPPSIDPPGAAPVPPSADATGPASPGSGPPMATEPPAGPGPDEVRADAGEPARSHRSRWLVGGAVAAVLAVGAAGVFAVANLTGSSAGGASDPEALGNDLLAAIEAEDVLGVVDVLLPGERDVLRDPMVDVVSELVRLEVLSPDADLADLAGIDIELSGERVRALPTNVDDIVNVELSADVVATVDGGELPIGALITDNLPPEAVTELRGSRATETDTLEVTMTAVEHDGRWYFSAGYTVAELARAEAGPGLDVPADGLGARGAGSPEAALDQLFDSVESLDLAGLIQTLNPGEAGALQRYAPLFLDEAEAALDDVPLNWQISRREFRVDGDGDQRTVLIDALGIEGDVEGEPFSIVLAGDCVSVEAAGESFEQCASDGAATAELDEFLAESPAIDHLVAVFTDAFADIEPVGVEVRRFDGAWYVTPFNTMTEAVLAVLRALDRSELDAIIEAVPPAFDELFGGLFGGFDSDSLFDEGLDGDWAPFPDASSDASPDDGFDDGFDDGANGEAVEPRDGSLACYDIEDAAEAGSCFRAFVAEGEIQELSIPIELRFPECGYAEVAWSGQLYSLPDDAFIAAATAAQPCFLDLAEQGVVSSWELPSEITHLECFEGRNWYNTFGDTDYDDRYYDCIDVPVPAADE